MANFPTSIDGDGSLLFAKNFIRTTVRVDMTAGQTTIPVLDATTWPDPAGATYYAVIDAPTAASREVCGYTGRDLTGGANALTGVTRGLGGTTATTHLTGVLVELNIVAAFHDAVKSALIAVQTKVGVDGSATQATHDFKLGEVTSTDKAVGKTATQTLTNKTLTAPTIGTSVTFSSATTDILPGATATRFRNNANTFDNLNIADSGAVLFRSTVGGITTLTATTLAGTLSTAAQANVTSLGVLSSLSVSGSVALGATSVTGNIVASGNIQIDGTSLIFTTGLGSVIPGVTSLTFRNNANNASNMVIADAGAVTFRSTVSGITTLTATTLAGTLSTAAQANVTSLGTLSALSVTGNVTVTGGTMNVNNAGYAAFFRQYYSAAFGATFAASATIDFNSGNVQTMTLTGNITTLTLSNALAGGRYVLLLLQDATGGRTVAWPAAVKWPGGTAPTLSGANKMDAFGFIRHTDGNFYSSSVLNY